MKMTLQRMAEAEIAECNEQATVDMTENSANDERDIFVLNEQGCMEVYAEVLNCAKWLDESDLY